MGDKVSKCFNASKEDDEDEKPATSTSSKNVSKAKQQQQSKKRAGYAVSGGEEEEQAEQQQKKTSTTAAEKSKRQKEEELLLSRRIDIFGSNGDTALTSLALVTENIISLSSKSNNNNNGIHFCVGSEDGDIALVRSSCISSEGKVLARVKIHKNEVSHLRKAKNCDLLFGASRDKRISVSKVSAREGIEVQSYLEGHTLSVTAIDLIEQDNREVQQEGEEGDVSSSSFPTLCVTGSRDNTVRLFDIETSQCLQLADLKLNLVHCVKWLPQMGVVAQGGEDLAIRLWDIRFSALKKSPQLPLQDEIAGFDYHPICCDIAPNGTGHTLVVGHNGFNENGSTVSFWDLRMRKLLHHSEGHSNTVRRICSVQNHDSSYVVSGSDDNTLRAWSSEGTFSCLAKSSVNSRIASLQSFRNNNHHHHQHQQATTKKKEEEDEREGEEEEEEEQPGACEFIAAFRDGEVCGYSLKHNTLKKKIVFA